MARTKTLSVEDVQGHTRSLRDELASIAERLRVLQGTVAPHLPTDADAEAMTAGTRPASVAWDVHGWLGEAEFAVRDAVETLDRATTATADTLLADWLRRLCDSDDHTAFEILSTKFQDSPGGDVRVPLPAEVAGADAKSVRRALVIRMAEQLYQTRTGGQLEIRQRLRKGYRWTRGVKVTHITRRGEEISLCGRGKGPDVGADGRDRRTCKACWVEYSERPQKR